MAIGDGWPTLSELTKQFDPDGKTIAPVGELLSYTNEILQDMPFYEANGSTTHRHTVDASIPRGTWRKLNYGIKPSKGKTAQVTDQIGLLEARSEVDVVLARMSNDIAKFRLNEDRRHLEGLNQDLAETLFYNDVSAHPERYLGLAPRYDSLGQPANVPSANSQGMDHVLDAGGTTASKQSSIWLIGWGENSVFGLYPQGSPAGMERQDLGEIDCLDADGGKFRGLATHYRIQQGLAVKDWRYIVRIANIETTAAITSTVIDKVCDMMIDATNAIPYLGACRPVFYMNRATKSRLQKAALRKTNMALGFEDIYGIQNQLNISSIPIKQCDSLMLTEAVVS